MSARTHSRHHAPAAAGDTGARGGGTGPKAVGAGARGVVTGPRVAGTGLSGVGTGLRWWAVVLPVIAFSALLLLMTGAGQAQAAAGHSPLAFLGWIQLALTGS
ncbi:hypothetical protein [Streptomyces wuyuanensis]|uniref:hypothetical protein n=1 Tax=Streptomyces wuyuanensis TaxID=1196353 RepID=UPI0037F4620A